jgi:hypothetical protein
MVARAEYVDQGTWGCYYYPRVPCRGAVDAPDDVPLGSKVQVTSEFLRNEIEVYRRIHRAPRLQLHFVLPARVCALRTAAQLAQIRECAASFEDEAAAAAEAAEGAAAEGAAESASLGPFAYDAASTWVNLQIPHVPNAAMISRYLRARPAAARWQELLSCYLQLTEAVAELGALGVVHWDLHTSNVLVDGETGRVKVIDFGLAIAVDSPESRAVVERNFGVQPTHARFPLETQLLLLTHQRARRHRRAQDGEGREGEAEGEAEADDGRTNVVLDTVRYLLANTRLFELFTPEFRRRYLDGALRLYGGYRVHDGNRARASAAAATLWDGWATWDNYALSVMFLRLLCRLFDGVFPADNPQFAALVAVLMRNLHYDWRERHSAAETARRARAIVEGAVAAADVVDINQRPSYLREGARQCAPNAYCAQDICDDEGDDEGEGEGEGEGVKEAKG